MRKMTPRFTKCRLVCIDVPDGQPIERSQLDGAKSLEKDVKALTLAASIMLLPVFLAGAEFARAQTWQECNSMLDKDTHGRLQQLFRYAQIAERPKHQDNDYMRHCPLSDGQIVAAPTNVVPLPFTSSGVQLIHAKLQSLAEEGGFKRAYLAVDENDDALLSIGCRGRNDSSTLPIFITIRAYLFLAADYLNLGITFAPEVVDSDENGNFTRVVWAPYFDKERQEFVYGLRGTDLSDLRQVLANYVGEKCAFPAVNLAVRHVCDSFYKMVQKQENSDATGFFSVSEAELTNMRNAKSYRTALAGHSLGGQAAQYIAANPPKRCSFNWEISDDTFRAYAFASTRNPSENSTGGTQSESEILESYLLHGDEVLAHLGLGQEQTGRVTTYYPDDNAGLGNRHGIANIRYSICKCLRGSGQFSTQ